MDLYEFYFRNEPILNMRKISREAERSVYVLVRSRDRQSGPGGTKI